MYTKLLFVALLLLSGGSVVFGQVSREDEVRGVWVHPGTFSSDESAAVPQIRATLDGYTAAGINTVMLLVKSTSGHLYYPSALGVRDSSYNWDFLGKFLEEARKRKITVHPWFCVFTESALLGRVRERPDWLIRGKKNELLPVVNPALAEVRAYEIGLIKELVDKYPVGWVHLDYIRYPCDPSEDYFSFDAKTRSLFKEYSGQDIAAARSMDSGNILWNEWIAWNGAQVDQFLRELREALGSTTKQVKISAAVFPDAENARALIGQDWRRWAREGLVDMLCPMLYTGNRAFFDKYVQKAVDIARGHCLMCAGIGITTSHNHCTPAEVIAQTVAGRSLGADGFVLFSSGSLTEEYLKAMKNVDRPD